jgi:hypothetical protein
LHGQIFKYRWLRGPDRTETCKIGRDSRISLRRNAYIWNAYGGLGAGRPIDIVCSRGLCTLSQNLLQKWTRRLRRFGP